MQRMTTKLLFTSVGIFKQSMGARNRVGTGLSYRPARLHSLAEFGSLKSILGLPKSLKLRPLCLYPLKEAGGGGVIVYV